MKFRLFLLLCFAFCNDSFCLAQSSPDGSGKYDSKDTCYVCKGKGKVSVKCETCAGKGLIYCSACTGNGVVKQSTNFGDTYLNCQRCQGKGLVKCTVCKGGKRQNVFCENCQGKGFLKSTKNSDYKVKH
jgi:DnaJ-class molecular chaperone